MLDRVTTVALGPLLLAQGQWVRRRIPRLPEPAGPRAGTLGDGAPLRLLIAGDSAAAGVGVAHQDEALSGQLARRLARDFCVSWTLIARSGYTSREIIEALRGASAEPYDVALVSIGVNDATAGLAPRPWGALQCELIELLQARFGVRHVLLSGVPPMHRFPALPQPLRWYIGERARRLNRELATLAGTQARCEVLPTSFALDAAAMAADGFHPGPAIYAAWAAEAAQRIAARWPAPPPSAGAVGTGLA